MAFEFMQSSLPTGYKANKAEIKQHKHSTPLIAIRYC
jgi:hypothetical protein